LREIFLIPKKHEYNRFSMEYESEGKEKKRGMGRWIWWKAHNFSYDSYRKSIMPMCQKKPKVPLILLFLPQLCIFPSCWSLWYTLSVPISAEWNFIMTLYRYSLGSVHFPSRFYCLKSVYEQKRKAYKVCTN
jgi:hypothetical protein